MNTARFGGALNTNNLRETKRALKIYKDIREDPRCRLKLNQQQSIMIERLEKIPQIIQKWMMRNKQTCLEELRSSDTSVRLQDLSLTLYSSGDKSSRSVFSAKGQRTSIHQRIKTEPLNIEALYNTRDEMRFYLFSIVLTKALSRLFIKSLGSAFSVLKQSRKIKQQDFLNLLIQLQNKGKILIRPLVKIQKSSQKFILQTLYEVGSQFKSLRDLNDIIRKASKRDLEFFFHQLVRQASENRLRKITPQDHILLQNFILVWYKQALKVRKTQRLVNTMQIELRQAFFMIKFSRRALKLANPTLKGRLGSIIIEAETCRTIKNKSILPSPLLQYGDILYLGAMEMIIENGEEVLINRSILVTQEIRLWLIKRNTRNPEELMLLKPRERSNSIEKLDVIDVVQKVMDNQSTMIASETRASLKKLTKNSRSSTSKQLLSTVRPRLKPFKQLIKSDQTVIMLPSAPEYQKGTMYKQITAKFNFLMSRSGSDEEDDDESQSSKSGEVTNRYQFMKASRSFMIQETPPMRGSIHFSISEQYVRKEFWEFFQTLQRSHRLTLYQQE